MTLAARPPLARILAIDAAIRGGRFPNSVTLASELEVDPRTVQRDVEFLRDRLGAPLAFCRRNNGYAYASSDFQLPFVHFSEGELVALILAEGALSQYRGTPWEADLSRAVRRLVTLLPEGISLDLGRLSQELSISPPAVTPQNPEILSLLVQLVQRRERLRMSYRTAAQGLPRERQVDPYHLAVISEDCYLIAHCHDRQEIRMFATPRILAAQGTGERFSRPADFNPSEYLAGNFRAVRGLADSSYAVLLRFTPEFAGRIAEKHWHHSQRVEPQPDGSLFVRMTLSNLTEITRWVLSWGRECMVVEPPELREAVTEEITRMASLYGIGKGLGGRITGKIKITDEI